MSESTVSILDGNIFVVSDDTGDFDAALGSPTGLFAFDTRFLSRWILRIDGRRLTPLSVDDVNYYEARFFLTPGEATQYVDERLSVIRERTICSGMFEKLVIINHAHEPVDLTVRIDIGSDFADIFEVKDVLIKRIGSISSVPRQDHLALRYERETFSREVRVRSVGASDVDAHGLTLTAHIEPHEQWSTDIEVSFWLLDKPVTEISRRSRPLELCHDLDEWMAAAPVLSTDSEALRITYRRSLIDLAALRFTPASLPGHNLPAAGLPWFMTFFGRDSIITSYQTLPFAPDLARTALTMLATLQGSVADDFRDEDPGKIMHELRYGESAAFEEEPHTPYFGSADSTPLFVILLDEYERWTGDRDFVRLLEQEARAALTWIDEYGDLMGDGYIWYERRNLTTGLENQCWKDSWDSVCYRDGRFPPLPRATCELQGYAYDAKLRGARLAREVWQDPQYARSLESSAAELRERFNREWWVADGEYFALGRDPSGGQVDALSSNIGHLLWSGIVDEERAGKLAKHLLGPRLFSGWGVRTLATGQARYSPLGYHVGTVWPFDNSFIAHGLARYGFTEHAAIIAEAMIDAAAFFDGRLPEAFAGYDRTATRFPVRYPTACSPQAWSTGTVFLLLRTLLGLEPNGEQLIVRPAIGQVARRIRLTGIRGQWGRAEAAGSQTAGGERLRDRLGGRPTYLYRDIE